jgi:hypothetical protein
MFVRLFVCLFVCGQDRISAAGLPTAFTATNNKEMRHHDDRDHWVRCPV